jgi:hypothetical protein
MRRKLTNSMEKNKQSWKKFQQKMNELQKKQAEILARISKKLDDQHIEKLRDRLKKHE